MISIIVPIYNAETYINRCINSVLAQTYDSWELILVNDGSSDNSKRICQELVSRDNRISLISQQNQGASIARRVGIEHAHGEYLTFIDCDDYIEPNYLSLLYEALVNKNVNISMCEMAKHEESTIIDIPTQTDSTTLDIDNVLQRFFKYDFWGFWGKLYKKRVFERIYFPTHTINEDYVVMLQLFCQEKSIAYVNSPLYHYLIHPNSLSHQQLSKRAMDEYYNKLWAYNFCKENLHQYIKHAEAQLTESCIKLLAIIHQSPQIADQFKEIKMEMKSFLKNHIISIICNQHLLIVLKINAIKYMVL